MVLFSGHGREGGTKSGLGRRVAGRRLRYGRRALDTPSFDEGDDCGCCG